MEKYNVKYLLLLVLLVAGWLKTTAATPGEKLSFSELKATATSFWQDHLPENAFDGNSDTYWQGMREVDALEARFSEITVNQITTLLNPDLVIDAELFILPAGALDKEWVSVSKISKFSNSRWVAEFEKQAICGIKTQINSCAHRFSPEKKGEWCFILEQIPTFIPNQQFAANLPVASLALKPDGDLVVDGILDEVVWHHATQIANFTWEGKRAEDDSSLYLLADENNFYIGGHLVTEHPEAIKTVVDDNNHPLAIWGGDVLELFFASSVAPSDYIQVVLGAGGNHKLMSNCPDTIQSAAKITQDGWTVEACIPWKAVGLTGLEDLPIRFNAARDNRTRSELSSWGPLYGGFHKPNLFGVLLPPNDSPSPRVGSLEWDGGEYCSLPLSISNGQLVWKNANSHRIISTVSSSDVTSGSVRLPVPPLPFTGQLELIDAKGEVQYRNSAVRFEQDPYKTGINKLHNLLQELPSKERQDFLQRIPEHISEDQLGELIIEVVKKRLELIDPNGVIGIISAMTKILPKPLFQDEWQNEIDLSTARREYENFQVLVSAPFQDLTINKITLSELRSSSGEIFPGTFRFYRVGNVKSPERNLPTALPGGVYPDPLFPFTSFTVKAGHNAAIWGEVFTPAETVPGKYSGTLTISRNPGDQVMLPVNITVYSVVLPVERSLATPFIIDRVVLAEKFGYEINSPEHLAQIEAYRKANAEHRLDWLYCPGGMHEAVYPRCIWDGKKLQWDFSEFDQMIKKGLAEGMHRFSIGFSWAHLPPIVDLEGKLIPEASQTIDIVQRDHPELAKAMTIAWKEYAQHLRENNWLHRAYYYVADEPIPEHYDAVRKQAEALLAADNEFQTMLTIMNPSAFGDIVKIWCPNLAFFDPKLAGEELAKGKEVWWYVCIGSARPNYYVDFPAIDPRIHFWLTYRYKLTGILYWRVNCWPRDKDVTMEAHDFGDGYLYYPGTAGPIPSIRIKMIRDGAEDYELLKLLESYEPNNELLNLETWCPSTIEYPLDPFELEKRRIQILTRIDELVRK